MPDGTVPAAGSSGGETEPPCAGIDFEDLRQALGQSRFLGGERIDIHETHAAVVFVGRELALKVKRPVRYDYLDFSSPGAREAACRRELEVNSVNAPEIYLRLARITREADGRLAIDGQGSVVEHGVLMRAFAQSDVLCELASAHGFAPELPAMLADAVAAMHRRAQIVPGVDLRERMTVVAGELGHAFARFADVFDEPPADPWLARILAQIETVSAVLARRAAGGRVRRCHGDLHLGNIVVWQGRPTPFDAIEFDETLAVIDTLYDLAFLIMDLDERGLRAAANGVLNGYLGRSAQWLGETCSDRDGLAALPAYLSLRAGVRAMVAAQRAALSGDGAARVSARRYYALASKYLEPTPACLIAIGGLSGSGKSTLAARLAPGVGRCPGAVVIRSDLERKAMLGAEATQRLAAESYTPAASRAVYDRVIAHAVEALAAGHSVIADAVWGQEDERRAVAQAAASCGARFMGLWLTAPESVLIARVAARRGDASDATTDVVRQQLACLTAPTDWAHVDASSSDIEERVAVATSLLERMATGLRP